MSHWIRMLWIVAGMLLASWVAATQAGDAGFVSLAEGSGVMERPVDGSFHRESRSGALAGWSASGKGLRQGSGSDGEPVLTFEGLQNMEAVQGYYAGGPGGEGSGPGPEFGITFSTNALALISETAGGTGQFANNPSGDTVLIFLKGEAATMNLPGGFTGGLSFHYAACCETGEITVFDGVDGTGNVVAQLSLPITPPTGQTPYPNDNWQPVGVEFSSVARSVDFGGTADHIGFDQITIGSAQSGGGLFHDRFEPH